MDVESIAKTIFFSVLLICALALYRFFIHRLIKDATQKLWFASGVFTLLSVLIVFSDKIDVIIENPKILFYFTTALKVFWWFSLNYFVNQVIEFWVWNRLMVKKGIIISRILRDLISIIIMIFTIASIIYFVFDRSVLGIFTASGVMAIILGYSAQATLGDIFAGLGLNTSKEFIEGDWIKVNENVGKVVDINWRFVKMVTKDNNHLSYANSVISKLPIVNLSSPTSVRAVILTFPLPASASPALVKNLLVTAALQCPKVLKKPAPTAALVLFKEMNYQYQLVCYTNEIDESMVNDEVLSVVWYLLRRHKIKTTMVELPIPENPPLNLIKSFLKNTDIFKSLKKEDIAELAIDIIYHHYGPPERVLEQGQSNSSLFLIYSGSVNVFISNETLHHQKVATINAGQYFGEMSLLTGEAVTASIYVNEESLILEINHDNIADLFAKKPILMEKISEIVVLRKQQNIDIQTSMTKGQKAITNSLVDRMVNKVKLFFKSSIAKRS